MNLRIPPNAAFCPVFVPTVSFIQERMTSFHHLWPVDTDMTRGYTLFQILVQVSWGTCLSCAAFCAESPSLHPRPNSKSSWGRKGSINRHWVEMPRWLQNTSLYTSEGISSLTSALWLSGGLWTCRTGGRDIPLLLLVAERTQFEQLRIPEVLKRSPKKAPITWEGAPLWADTREVVHTIASFSMFAKTWVSFSRLASSSTTIFWKVSSLLSLAVENRNKFHTLTCNSTRQMTTPSAPNLLLGRNKHPCWTTWGSFALRYVSDMNSCSGSNWRWV